MRLGPIGPRRRPEGHLAAHLRSAAGYTAHLAGEPDDVEGQRCERCGVVLTIPTEMIWPTRSWVAVEDLDRSPSDWPHRSLASRHFMIGLGSLVGTDEENALNLLDWEVRGGAICAVPE